MSDKNKANPPVGHWPGEVQEVNLPASEFRVLANYARTRTEHAKAVAAVGIVIAYVGHQMPHDHGPPQFGTTGMSDEDLAQACESAATELELANSPRGAGNFQLWLTIALAILDMIRKR